MKRLIFVLTVLILLSLACSLSGADEDAGGSTPLPAESDKRCGDEVCDGPENSQNCPQDCGADAASEQQRAEPTQDQAQPEDKGSEPVFGYVFSRVTLDRTPGNGNCGISPWGNDPSCTMGIKIWWGLHLEAFAQTPVLIVQDGDARWVITNHTDVAGKYGIDLAGFKPTEAGYEVATIDFSPTPECSGTIEGNDFNFQVMGTRTDQNIELILSADPVEHISGSCAGAGFDQQLTNLLYGWAQALSGDPLDLTGVLLADNAQSPGDYLHAITIDTNPSPENRDRVSAQLGLICLGSEVTNASVMAPVACPWEE